MTDGRDPFPFTPDDDRGDLGPVAEYRDPELARRFEADPVPDHRAGFWDQFDRTIGAARPGSGGAVPPPLELVEPPAPDPGWSRNRWLAVAAAVLAVVGLGGAVLIAADRDPSTLEAATDQTATQSTVADPATEVAEGATTTTMAVTTTTAPAPSTSAVATGTVDYFGPTVVTGIGRGLAVAFSPDDSAILLVDDAPGVELGCEGSELLTLYTQDLATGGRRLTLGPGSTIETGGISFRPAAGIEPSPSPGTRTYFWNEYCDGSLLATRRGQLSPDGVLSMVEEVRSDEAIEAFATAAVAEADSDAAPSPGGRFALEVAGGTATVVDVESSERRSLPAEITPAAVRFGVWAPGGEVVALAADGQVIVWNHLSGEHRDFSGARADRMLFDNGGRRLALVSIDGVPSTSVLSFGDLPEVAPAAPRCSGATDLPPLDADGLVAGGLPADVVDTVIAIDAAAAACDWDGLRRLAGEDFVASFGGGEPTVVWQEDEAHFGSPMWTLRMLLRQPYGTSTDAEPIVFAWPELFLREGCDFDEADREMLDRIGYPEYQAVADCEALGGYGGYRTGIDRTGSWRFYVAGD